MRYYWTDERHQIIYIKRVTHAVKMVGSCSRENGVLCTVAWSWLLFLHDEKVWKNFESSIAWGVDELYQTFWFWHFFNGKLQYSWFVECTDYIFMDWFARCHLSMNVWLKLTMEDLSIQSTKDGWVFFLGGLFAVNFMVNIVVCYFRC